MSANKDALSSLQRNAGVAASMLRALANERRLMILCLLIARGELTAGELADEVELSPSALSQHLAKMREEGLLATRRDAQTVFYRIADPNASRVLKLLKEIYCP